MTFKAGDKVKFLNEVGGGTVTRIKQQTAYVKTSDGFEIPALFSEIIKVEETGFGGMKPEPVVPVFQPKQQPVFGKREEAEETEDEFYNDTEDNEVITSENCTLNILLGLVPVKRKNGEACSGFQIYLISDCDYHMLYTFSVVKDNFVRGRKAGHVENDTKVQVDTFMLQELKEIQSFKINCIFYKKGIYLPHEPVIYEYKTDALFLADPDNWTENDYFDENAMIINVTEMSLLYEIERMVTETEDKYIIQKKRKGLVPKKLAVKPASSASPDMEEVDLHIEHLIEDYSAMTPGEIMDMQLSRFTIALEGAIRGKTKKIVFIHGLGNGKLKYEICKTLDRKYPKLRYQDASFKEYGYGATMVLLK
jgi:hypothetical protein